MSKKFTEEEIKTTLNKYFKKLNLENDNESKAVLFLLFKSRIEGQRFKPNDKCFCLSSKKIKICENHLSIYRSFKEIDKVDVEKDFEVIEYDINNALRKEKVLVQV